MLGPHIKFKLNNNCIVNNSDRNIGAIIVVGLGIKKISFDNILNKSARIWKAPLRPIIVGPIRRCAKASIFLSVNTIKRTVKTQVNDNNKAIS